MKYKSYNNEIRIATAQILDVFNNIVIDRQNGNKQISVPCIYGNRSRILKDIENRNKTIKLPVIAISMVGMVRDTTRVNGINNGLFYQDGTDTYNPLKNMPTPINIEYEISILTKYQSDMDQILSNFIPFMNPDIYVVWKNPKDNTQTIRSQVIWDGNISITYPTDISETDPSRVEAMTNFTFKTWIFTGEDEDDNGGPTIERFNFNTNLITIGDDGYMLDRWYSVPSNMSFDDYIDNVVCGYVRCYDLLQMSGGLSGYWSDISGLITGDDLGVSISGNPVWLSDDNGNILVVNESPYLSLGMEAIDFIDYFYDSLTGSLSSY